LELNEEKEQIGLLKARSEVGGCCHFEKQKGKTFSSSKGKTFFVFKSK
jgi:hypothetical protein